MKLLRSIAACFNVVEWRARASTRAGQTPRHIAEEDISELPQRFDEDGAGSVEREKCGETSGNEWGKAMYAETRLRGQSATIPPRTTQSSSLSTFHRICPAWRPTDTLLLARSTPSCEERGVILGPLPLPFHADGLAARRLSASSSSSIPLPWPSAPRREDKGRAAPNQNFKDERASCARGGVRRGTAVLVVVRYGSGRPRCMEDTKARRQGSRLENRWIARRGDRQREGELPAVVALHPPSSYTDIATDTRTSRYGRPSRGACRKSTVGCVHLYEGLFEDGHGRQDTVEVEGTPQGRTGKDAQGRGSGRGAGDARGDKKPGKASVVLIYKNFAIVISHEFALVSSVHGVGWKTAHCALPGCASRGWQHQLEGHLAACSSAAVLSPYPTPRSPSHAGSALVLAAGAAAAGCPSAAAAQANTPPASAPAPPTTPTSNPTTTHTAVPRSPQSAARHSGAPSAEAGARRCAAAGGTAPAAAAATGLGGRGANARTVDRTVVRVVRLFMEWISHAACESVKGGQRWVARATTRRLRKVRAREQVNAVARVPNEFAPTACSQQRSCTRGAPTAGLFGRGRAWTGTHHLRWRHQATGAKQTGSPPLAGPGCISRGRQQRASACGHKGVHTSSIQAVGAGNEGRAQREREGVEQVLGIRLMYNLKAAVGMRESKPLTEAQREREAARRR
ncbi:hypothetical protein DFH06DRAFT_1292174 [Mycena polygramma]|nr:hypothetical protein DFH06DRAFT_1292174 [Mycena polygramma]